MSTAIPATAPATAPVTSTDVLIVGAGPVGLFAAFQAGVLGLKCELIDVLDRAGGQCTELYPEKPIYDIPAVPGCLAQDLVDRLLEQCAPFDFPMHFGQRAESVAEIPARAAPEGHAGHERLLVTTDGGKRFDVAAVLVCAGAGAFAPQRVALPEAPALEGRHVHYAVRDVSHFAGK
ncbi:MAG: NAD(P)/FAD-dependent oxidoreductase, partial [Cupriavidus sp.]|nr:NAD(P)/FAD-dependent oxidoreductase [Cupriavidus sp.]